ncbi:MAG: xanthine dehydrogenase family protein molybdopterin-binding subunit [Syntrophobacteraceae bacterium]
MTSPNNAYSILGTSPVKLDAPDKATGAAKYTADLSLPGMLHGAILNSPLAHARILNVDTSRAERLPGVKAVITAREAGDVKFGHSPARQDENIFTVDKVRYVGDEVAAIAAIDEQTAREAVELIRVDYEELPVVLDPFEALRDDSPLIHERSPRNICQEVHNHFGDVEQGFAQSYHVRTDRFMKGRVEGAFIEPQAALAHCDSSGVINLWSATQVSHYVQRAVAMSLRWPVEKVRVMVTNVGGGFGPKSSAAPHEMIAALLSVKTGLPVKIVLDRQQVFWRSRGRHHYYHEMKTGVSRDGKIQAFEHCAVLDGGAYSSLGIITVYYNGSLMSAPYYIPNMKYDGFRVFTNKPAAGSLRGHGGLSNRACFELQLDMIAKEIGMDPIEIRLKNALHSGDVTKMGYKVSSFHVSKCLTSAREDAGWSEKKGRMPKGKGIGVASGYFLSGAGSPVYRTEVPHSTVLIQVAEDGDRVTVFTGANEIGQGSNTVMAMLAAEVLGLKMEDMRVVSGDTALCPLDTGAYSSRQTLMTGHATKQAAEAIRDQILEETSRIFDIPLAELDLKGGRVQGTEKNPEKLAEIRGKYAAEHRGFQELPKEGPLTFKEINRFLYSKKGPLMGKGLYWPGELQSSKEWKGSVVGASPAYSSQTCVAEVSVDSETGELSILKLTLAHDCGFAINRQSVEGQLEGAMCQGLGEALFEEVLFDQKGRVVNCTLGDYKIPTALDVPDLSAVIIEGGEPNGPFGAKGTGEGCIIPIIPAILNAIYDACGVAIMDLPITAEKLLRALRAKQEKGGDTYIHEPPEGARMVLERAKELSRRD